MLVFLLSQQELWKPEVLKPWLQIKITWEHNKYTDSLILSPCVLIGKTGQWLRSLLQTSVVPELPVVRWLSPFSLSPLQPEVCLLSVLGWGCSVLISGYQRACLGVEESVCLWTVASFPSLDWGCSVLVKHEPQYWRNPSTLFCACKRRHGISRSMGRASSQLPSRH